MLPVLILAMAASTADTVRYAVTIQGNPAGAQTVVRESATRSTIAFEFNDRGRGPKTVTQLEVDARGLPRSVTITGNDYLKQQVKEQLVTRGRRVAWASTGERGSGFARSFFLPAESAPELLGVLARALLRTPAKRLGLLPGGEATIETLGARQLAGQNNVATLVAIDGLGLAPAYLWLLPDSTLLAVLSGWQRTIRDGWLPAAEELNRVQDSAASARSARIASELTDRPSGPVAFINATLFDAEQGRLVPGQTVLVEGNEIKAVGASASMRLSGSVRIINAAGKTLLPGLWDMHAHLSDVDGRLNIAAGVTTVRDMANDLDFLLATKKAFEAGTAIGPRVLMAGFMDGPGPYAGPTKALVSTKEQALEWVDRYAGLGYRQIKLYSSLDPALVPVIAERAHAKGLRLSGHIPRGMLAQEAVAAGYDEIQHTNMLFLNFLGDTLDTRTPLRFTTVAKFGRLLDLESDSVARFLDLLKSRGTVVDPTLATFEGMFTSDPGVMTPGDAKIVHRMPAQVQRGMQGGGLPADAATRAQYRASYAKMLAMVKALHDRGIPIVAGTDCPAGTCLHRELELYAQAGIPNGEVLRLATLGAANVMKQDGRLGSIAPGKLADLVLVRGNPLRNISDVRQVDLVMKDGLIFDAAKVYASLGVAPWDARAAGRR